MVKIIWTQRAFKQLDRSISYIRDERGLSYATIVLEEIIKSTSLLAEHPRIGQEEPLLRHKRFNYRYIVTFSYKIIYRVDEEKVVISRVFHSAQDPKKLKGV